MEKNYGHHATGIDMDPLALLLARVCTTAAEQSALYADGTKYPSTDRLSGTVPARCGQSRCPVRDRRESALCLFYVRWALAAMLGG